MEIRQTKYGDLPIAENRAELDTWGWDIDQALAWLALSDPNGEWNQYIENFQWASAELGELDLEDLLDEIWEQTRDS
jgi:hypothetical protein